MDTNRPAWEHRSGVSNGSNTAPDSRQRRGHDPSAATWVVLCAIFCLALVPSLGRLWKKKPAPAAPGCIDPNTAPWWELTLLPRIGMTTAFEIVRYRESVASNDTGQNRSLAFTQVADLAEVHGIGPVTLQRIGRYLCIPDSDQATLP